MRLFWRILAVFGGLLVLLIIAVAVAVRTIDVNDFVAPMQKRVKDATGRDLVIRGGIDFKLSLEPELMIDDVSLSNAEWGKSPQMLTAKRVEAQVKLLPLLRRNFEIVRFKLIDPVIVLETNAAGKGNWEFGDRGDANTPTPPATASSFAIGDVAIDHGTASFRDGGSGKITDVVIDELSLHSRNADAPVSARFRGKVGDIAVAMEGDVGPLQALAQRRWPYPVSLKGEINGQAASVATKMRIEGKTVNLDELQVGTGTSKLEGQLVLTPGVPRTRVSFKLTSPRLAWSDLPHARAVAHVAREAAGHDRFVFGEEPVDFAALEAADADADVTVGTLLLPNGRQLQNFRIQFSLRGGKLEAPLVEASAFGGNARGRLSIDATQAHAPVLRLHLDAKSLDAGALLDMFGMKREVRGGNTDVTLDLTARGESPRQWAHGVNGNVTVVVGTATLVHTKLDLDSPLNRLADAVNPFHRVDASTELLCAVARLPLKDGVAQIDHSVALETKKFGASVSGTLNLRDETLDLAIKPQVRRGIPIDVPQVASLVRFQGPLRSPTVHIDAAGSAVAAAKIGAAIYSGGLSLLGESLLSAVGSSGDGPCRAALAHVAAANPAAARTNESPGTSTPDSIGKAVGRLLGR